MANIIGSLLVELGINSAAWTAGLSKAQAQAATFGRQVTGSFASMGKGVTSFLGQMSQMGGVVGSAMSQVSGAIGGASQVALGLAGAFGTALGPIGLGAGLILAVGAAAVSTAVSMANLGERIENTAAVTGLSSTQVQIWNQLAEESGVSGEAVTRVIGRLNAQLGQYILKGGEAGGKGGAFIQTLKSLGISVTTASGQLRPINDILGDFSNKLAEIEDPGKRSALMMAALTIRGRELGKIMDAARRSGKDLGTALDEVAASNVIITPEQLAQLAKLDAAFDALGRRATGEWMQFKLAITDVIAPLEKVLSFLDKINASGKDKVFASKFKTADILSFAIGLQHALTEEPKKKETTAGEKAAAEAAAAASKVKREALMDEARLITAGSQAKLDLQEAEKEYQEVLRAGDEADGERAVALARNIKQLKEKVKAEEAATRVGRVQLDTVLKFISELESETASQLRLASAIGKTSAEIVLLTAAEKGREAIGKIRANLLAQISSKEKELASAGKAGNAQRRKETNDILTDLRRQVTALDASETQVISLEQAKAAAGLSRAFENSLVNDVAKLEMQAAALEALAEAYGKTGVEIGAARIQERMQGQNLALKIQSDLLAEMTAQWGAADPRVKAAADNFERVRAGVVAYGAALKKLDLSELNKSLAEQERVTKLDIKTIELQTSVLFQNAEAQRKAAIAAQVRAFIEAQPGAGAEQIARETAMLTALSDAKHTAAVAETAADLNARLAYDQRIEKIREVIAMTNVSRETQIAAAASAIEAARALTETLSNQAIQGGTTREALHGLFAQIALDGENLRVKVFGAIRTSIEGLSSELAKFVVTGKANFRSLFASLGENILKATFQKGLGGIAGFIGKKLGIEIPGLGGKRDGSSAGSALYVQPVGAGGMGDLFGGFKGKGGIFAGGEEGEEGGTGGIGGFFSKMSGWMSKMFSGIGGFFSKMFSSGGFFSKIIGGISSLFGGFLAAGGDVTPGKAYVVGEKKPELFLPRTAGRVVPSVQTGAINNTNLSVTFTGVTDMDTFRKNKAQIAAEFYGAASLAYARAR